MDSAIAASRFVPVLRLIETLTEEQAEIITQSKEDRTETDGDDIELRKKECPKGHGGDCRESQQKGDADQREQASEANPE
jgi:hypothetical protein